MTNRYKITILTHTYETVCAGSIAEAEIRAETFVGHLNSAAGAVINALLSVEKDTDAPALEDLGAQPAN